MLDIIKNRKIFVGIAIVLVILSWVAVAVFGLKPGIDLVGGSQWHFQFIEAKVTEPELNSLLSNTTGFNIKAKNIESKEFVVRLPDITEEEHQDLKDGVTEGFGEIKELSFTSVGPVIGRELRENSMWAIFGVLIGISLFVAWAFRKVSRPIKSWKYGIVALITLFHDVSIPVGVFAFLGWQQGIEVDTTFIIAILFVLGLSVNDTIVIFDRIRENLLSLKNKKMSLGEIVNKSVNESLMRSVNTSATLMVVLLSLLAFGPSSLFYFVLTVLIGTAVGTYSSIFVASPLLYTWGKAHK